MTLKRLKKKLFMGDGISMGGNIDPDEIFLDSSNLPQFDIDQFEGRLEKPISRSTFTLLGIVCLCVGLLFGGRLYVLQVRAGDAYALRSESNHLRHSAVFAERGIIYDRNKVELAWNDLNPDGEFSLRKYVPHSGFAHLVGYVKYPSKDKMGIYKENEDIVIGKDGVEHYFNDALTGKNGLKIIETDAHGEVASESTLIPPKGGDNVTLSVDVRVQAKLYEIIKQTVADRGFTGGSGVLMDVHNGEILAITSFPEYDQNIMTDASDSKAISSMLTQKNNPFLDRAISGLYIPGSIVKPYIAMGVLNEGIISPEKKIHSIGFISIPNPYDKTKKTIFKDWKIHGWVDMRDAISVSSDEYFYTVGGGYAGQKGIGILNIEKYMRMFGFGEHTGIDIAGEAKGNIPSPEWKKTVFKEDWRLGDTYNSSIGQYGFQVTPVQEARAVSVLANGGTLVAPTVIFNNPKPQKTSLVTFPKEYYQIVREGMRMAATTGTAKSLSMPGITVGAKTGTAELGITKAFVNSWVTGFFPYENPRFAFAVLMERGDRHNMVGASSIMRQLLEWMYENTPELVK